MIKLQLNYTDSNGNKKSKTYSYVNNLRTDAELKDFAQAINDLTTNTLGTVYKIDTNILLDDPSDDIVTPVIESTDTAPVQLLNPNFICGDDFQYVDPLSEDGGGYDFVEDALSLGTDGDHGVPNFCNIDLNWDGNGTVKLPFAYHFPLEISEDGRDVKVEYRNIGSTQCEEDANPATDGFTDFLPLTLTSDGEYSSATLLAPIHVVCRDDFESELEGGVEEDFWSAYRVVTNPAELATVLDSDVTQVIAAVQNNMHTDSLPQDVQNELAFSGALLGVFTAEYVHDNEFIEILLNCTPRDSSSEGGGAAVVYHNGTWHANLDELSIPSWVKATETGSLNAITMQPNGFDIDVGDFFTVFVLDN